MMNASTERANRTRVNNALYELGRVYHSGLPIMQIDEILTSNGFNATQPAIYCGREGRSNEQVGDRSFLSLSWHKMDQTGNYEVVAYVN
jgi:hypothetical protein